jgi:hypothetical protein
VNFQPLPPYLKLPGLRTCVEALNNEVNHVHNLGCAALAVLELSSMVTAEEVTETVELV